MCVRPGQTKKFLHFVKDPDHILDSKKNPKLLEMHPGRCLHDLHHKFYPHKNILIVVQFQVERQSH